LYTFLEILSSCYDGTDYLTFSDAVERSKMKVLPNFFILMKKLEECDLVRKSKATEGSEVGWKITKRGRKILRKYEELRREINFAIEKGMKLHI